MRRLAALCLAAVLWGQGCALQDKPIAEAEMAALLADVAIVVNAHHLNINGRQPGKADDRAAAHTHLAAVLQHHNVTPEAFWEAWYAYAQDLPALERLMDRLVTELNTRTAKRQGAFRPLQPGEPGYRHLSPQPR